MILIYIFIQKPFKLLYKRNNKFIQVVRDNTLDVEINIEFAFENLKMNDRVRITFLKKGNHTKYVLSSYGWIEKDSSTTLQLHDIETYAKEDYLKELKINRYARFN